MNVCPFCSAQGDATPTLDEQSMFSSAEAHSVSSCSSPCEFQQVAELPEDPDTTDQVSKQGWGAAQRRARRTPARERVYTKSRRNIWQCSVLLFFLRRVGNWCNYIAVRSLVVFRRRLSTRRVAVPCSRLCPAVTGLFIGVIAHQPAFRFLSSCVAAGDGMGGARVRSAGPRHQACNCVTPRHSHTPLSTPRRTKRDNPSEMLL